MKNSNKFSIASLILGLIALFTFPFIVPPLICGSLSILFAILSRTQVQGLKLPAILGSIAGTFGLVACIIISTVAINTTLRSIDWDSMLSSYRSLIEYTTTLSDEELLDFMDDIQRGDYSDFTEYYDLPIELDEQIWY